MKAHLRTYAIVDVETTGSSPVYDRVIEIGILRVENGEIVETFSTLIDPQKSIPPSITMITGIHSDDIQGAPLFNDVAEKIEALLKDAIFVAHNVRFDYGFIKNELKRSNISLNAKCLCTVRLSRKLFPEEKKHDLSSVISRAGLTCENRHRAFDDARALFDFMNYIKEIGRSEEMELSIRELLQENTLPQFLDERSVRKLPEGPGVYMFYGHDDELLYIGKSKNIRYRVLSHFSNDHASSKEMHLCQQTVRVEYKETPGELSALLLESTLIKENGPLYNRQLRRKSELVVARFKTNNGFNSVDLERLRIINPDDSKKILGIFRSVTQAKAFLFSLRDEHFLCSKLLGLEKGKGACFYKGLEKCRGACIGVEDADVYNKRFNEAFEARRLKSWPFKGPIIIEERKNDYEKHSFVLNNWCLQYSIITDEDGARVVLKQQKFDYDAYKIFYRYLKDVSNKKNIREINQYELEYSLQHIGEVEHTL